MAAPRASSAPPVPDPVAPAPRSVQPPRTALERVVSAFPEHPLRRRLHSARDLVPDPRAARPAPLPTALAPVDRLLDGGLARGRLVELVGRRSSGRLSIVLAALAAATGADEPAALVDLANGLDPQLATAAGVVLERLLWVRPQRLKEALIGAEMLLGGGFPLVVLDLGSPPVPGGRGAEAAWLRLARAAAARDAALLVSSPYRASGTAAATVLEARPARPLWRGAGASPRLLAGLRSRLALAKLDGRPLERRAALELRSPEAPEAPGARDAPPGATPARPVPLSARAGGRG